MLFVSVSDGRDTGFGECIPTSLYYPPGHIGRAEIDEWGELLKLAESLIGQDARRLGQLIPDRARSHDYNSIVDALDFAVHDLVGRRLGVPVSVLLGGVKRPWIRGIPVIFTASADEMAGRAAELHRNWGFRRFKLKPIGTAEADAETLRKIREKTAPDVRFYMDANYALRMDIDQAAAYINSLVPLGLEVYEDPIDLDLPGYRRLQERISARLMLDEKVRSPEKVLEVLAAAPASRSTSMPTGPADSRPVSARRPWPPQPASRPWSGEPSTSAPAPRPTRPWPRCFRWRRPANRCSPTFSSG